MYIMAKVEMPKQRERERERERERWREREQITFARQVFRSNFSIKRKKIFFFHEVAFPFKNCPPNR
jgi:hypothetical protein